MEVKSEFHGFRYSSNMMLLGPRNGVESVLGMKPLFLSHSVQHFSVKKKFTGVLRSYLLNC